MVSGVTQVASRKSARRDAIIEVAVTHFSERAYDDVFIDDVCRDAGVAHGLISYYFGGKRGVFAAAVERAWKDMLDYERPRGDEPTATDRIHGYIHRHFDYVQRHPSRFTGLMHNTQADPQIRQIAQAAQAEALIELTSSLGCPTNPPPALRIAIVGWAGFLDSATMDWLERGGVTLDEIVDLCQEALVAAVDIASGRRFDREVEEDALHQVSRFDD